MSLNREDKISIVAKIIGTLVGVAVQLSILLGVVYLAALVVKHVMGV